VRVAPAQEPREQQRERDRRSDEERGPDPCADGLLSCEAPANRITAPATNPSDATARNRNPIGAPRAARRVCGPGSWPCGRWLRPWRKSWFRAMRKI
jgi:hypothetical protein